jgi:molecular chaperone HtpG
MAAATTNSMVSTAHIPDDLAISILSKLPLKSLKRFTCVQKSWSHFFENAHFMNMFRSNFISKYDEKEENKCLLLRERIGTSTTDFCDNVMCKLSGDRFQDRVRLDWPPPFQEDNSNIEILYCASVNGILCLYQRHGNYFETTAPTATTALWNPTTREYKILPPSLRSYENIEFNVSLVGVGYDQIRDDYKVLRAAPHPIDHDNYISKEEAQVENYDIFWEIYSLRSNSWRIVDRVNMPIFMPCKCQVNLNEFCHWLVWFEMDIWSFDFTDEKFFITTLPVDSDNGYIRNEYDLMAWNESIAFICSYCNEPGYFHIWVLGELSVRESWTKFFVIGPLSCVLRPIGVGKKNQIYCTKNDGKLALFDLSTQRIEDKGDLICEKIAFYNENSLSIEGMNNKMF